MPGGTLAECGLHERRVGLHIRAHDDHVAGFETRIVREQVQQALAQHLHLPRRTVTGVDADRAVGGGGAGRGPVGPEVVLQAAQERVGAGPAGVVHVGDSGTGEVRA